MSIPVNEAAISIEVGEEEATLTAASTKQVGVDAAPSSASVEVSASTPALQVAITKPNVGMTAVIDMPSVTIGVPGPTGPPGPEGAAAGGSTGRFFDFTYAPMGMDMARVTSRSSLEEPMIEGTIHYDTDSEYDATYVFVSPLTMSDVDISARLVSLPAGTRLWIQDRDQSAMHATFILTGTPEFDDVMVAWEIPVELDPNGMGDPLMPGAYVLAGALDSTSGIPGPPGPEGAPGPAGPAGPAGEIVLDDLGFVHYQTTALDVWTINHTLIFQPNVTVVDSLKQEIFPGNIEYLTSSVIRLTFSAAVAGEAYLS